MTGKKSLLCFAHGREGAWEGQCLDLDIAVQGDSFDEVRSLLSEAIDTYFADAAAEAPADRARLLARRAPLSVRLGFMARFVAHVVFGRKRDDDFQAGFELPCPV